MTITRIYLTFGYKISAEDYKRYYLEHFPRPKADPIYENDDEYWEDKSYNIQDSYIPEDDDAEDRLTVRKQTHDQGDSFIVGQPLADLGIDKFSFEYDYQDHADFPDENVLFGIIKKHPLWEFAQGQVPRIYISFDDCHCCS